MRTFKFRGWDKRAGGWFYFELSPLSDKQWIEAVWNDVDIDWGKVCQYTGLHDKNGKEIYEGDVMWGMYGEQGDGSVLEDVKLKVVYSAASFQLQNGWICRDLSEMCGDKCSIYVIGNIHQHPALLA